MLIINMIVIVNCYSTSAKLGIHRPIQLHSLRLISGKLGLHDLIYIIFTDFELGRQSQRVSRDYCAADLRE